MAEEKKKVPKNIQEFYKRSDQVDTLVDITEQSHSSAYLTARKHLKDHTKKDGLQVLEEAKHQDFFIDALVNAYLNEIKQNENIDIPKDDFEKDVMLQRYIGVTKSELGQTIRDIKGKYSSKVHEELRDQLVGKQKTALSAARTSHMTDADLDDILKHTKTHEMFNKDLLNLTEGARILDHYKNNGEFTYNTIDGIKRNSEGQVDMNKYLTKEARKAKKEMKDNYKKAE
jgi:hypothetical protein